MADSESHTLTKKHTSQCLSVDGFQLLFSFNLLGHGVITAMPKRSKSPSSRLRHLVWIDPNSLVHPHNCALDAVWVRRSPQHSRRVLLGLPRTRPHLGPSGGHQEVLGRGRLTLWKVEATFSLVQREDLRSNSPDS